jgi:hypothetical protein
LFNIEGAELVWGRDTTNTQASGFICSQTIDEFNLLCIAALEAEQLFALKDACGTPRSNQL